MDKKNLEKLSKSELIELLLKQQKPKIIVEDATKPVPAPRTYKSVKDMVQQYEDNINLLQSLERITNLFQNREPKNHHKLLFLHQFLKKEQSFHKLKKHCVVTPNHSIYK